MKKYRYEYKPDPYRMPELADNVLFIDIETTGFQRTSTYLTVIGLAWQEKDTIIIEQWFNDTGRQGEPPLLLELEHFLKNKGTLPQLIHYNGTTFDLPYLKVKYEQYHLPTALCDCCSIDLYKLAKKYKCFLGLNGIKQKHLEEFFGLFREDKLSGQELIDVYLNGIQSKDGSLLSAYLLHNKEDMEGMVFLQHLLKLHRFMEGNFEHTKWLLSPGNSTLSVTLNGDFYLHSPIFHSLQGIHFYLESGQALLSIPVKEMEAKFFYANYKDYYYLPAEDQAMHKSVAEYVEKAYRQKATKETCYIKKRAFFLPLPLPNTARKRKTCLEPCGCLEFFYETYGDITAWIDAEVQDPVKQIKYLHALFQMLT